MFQFTYLKKQRWSLKNVKTSTSSGCAKNNNHSNKPCIYRSKKNYAEDYKNGNRKNESKLPLIVLSKKSNGSFVHLRVKSLSFRLAKTR